MVLTFDQIVSTLKKHVVRIGYGTPEVKKKSVRCSLCPNYLPNQIDIEELANFNRTVSILSVWDVDNKKWVIIDLDRIINFEPEV